MDHKSMTLQIHVTEINEMDQSKHLISCPISWNNND